MWLPSDPWVPPIWEFYVATTPGGLPHRTRQPKLWRATRALVAWLWHGPRRETEIKAWAAGTVSDRTMDTAKARLVRERPARW